METRVAIVGAGDLGKTLATHIVDYADMRTVGFFDDSIAVDVGGLPILGRVEDIQAQYDGGKFDKVVMGIGYNHLKFRLSLFASLSDAGIPFATLIHPSAYVHRTASIGVGSILFPRCVVDAHSSVGRNTLLNTGCIIAHDTMIGDGCFLGPGVSLAGFITVGERCFLGVGSIIKDNIRLADGCRAGAGAVVIEDVPADILVVGVPARPVKPKALPQASLSQQLD